MLVAETIWGEFPIGNPNDAEFVKRDVKTKIEHCDGHYAVMEIMYVIGRDRAKSFLEAKRLLAIRHTEQDAERVARKVKDK